MTEQDSFFERIFNPWVLLAINIVILFIVEATGSLFLNTGLIHLVAIIFIALGIGRIFVNYDIHDQFLKPFLNGGTIVLILFAIAHILEYSSYSFLSFPYEIVAVNVVNLYLAGLLILTFSVFYFLARINQKLKIFQYISAAGVVLCLFASIIFSLDQPLVEFSSNWLPYVYVAITLAVTIVAFLQLSFLKRHVGILAKFIDYFNAAIILIATSALLYVLNETIITAGIPFVQIVYLGHFLFYGALSLMFLAYRQLAHLGGVYATVEQLKKENKLPAS